MNKLELFKLAASIYPCPPFEGDKVKILIMYAPKYSLFYFHIYHNCRKSEHIIIWLKIITRFINICFIDCLLKHTENI